MMKIPSMRPLVTALIVTASIGLVEANSAVPAAAPLRPAVSNAPTVAVQPNNYIPRMTQRDKDERVWLAAIAGNLPALKDMLQKGGNPRSATPHGETALHAAAARGHLQVVIYLASHGGNIHERTRNGWTPLHHAARFGRVNVASYLLRAGANPYQPTRDTGRKTPIDIALDRRDMRMARTLGY